ncbi:hypothetical protein D3C87_1675990 [compost metagenome]
MQPATRALLRRCLRIAEVLHLAGGPVQRPEQQLTRLPRCTVVTSLIDYSVAQVRHHFADAAHRADADRLDRQATLGGPVEFKHLHAEALLEIFPDSLRHTGGNHEANWIVAVIRPVWLRVERSSHASQQGEAGTAVLAADIPQPGLSELARKHAT